MKIQYRLTTVPGTKKAAYVIVDGKKTQLIAVEEFIRRRYNLYFEGTDGTLLRLTTWHWESKELLQADIVKRLEQQHKEWKEAVMTA